MSITQLLHAPQKCFNLCKRGFFVFFGGGEVHIPPPPPQKHPLQNQRVGLGNKDTHWSSPSAGPPGSTSEMTIDVSPFSKWGLSLPPDTAIPNPLLESCSLELREKLKNKNPSISGFQDLLQALNEIKVKPITRDSSGTEGLQKQMRNKIKHHPG